MRPQTTEEWREQLVLFVLFVGNAAMVLGISWWAWTTYYDPDEPSATWLVIQVVTCVYALVSVGFLWQRSQRFLRRLRASQGLD